MQLIPVTNINLFYNFISFFQPLLMFAGEATHPTFYSTTHGAYLSGRKCAELLLEPDPDQSKKHSGEESDQSGAKDLSSWIRGIDLT